MLKVIQDFALQLKQSGCQKCYLGKQSDINGIVVYRGNPESRRMIIGEGPGAIEDSCGQPFTGPAGILLDKIFASVEWDTNKDWYLGNVIKCRPKAPPGYGKQNLTPIKECLLACRPYIKFEISTLKPRVVVLQGLSAARSLLELPSSARMKDLAGKFVYSNKFPNIPFYIMYHAAALLHAQKNPDLEQQLKQATWNHIRYLREWVDKNELL